MPTIEVNDASLFYERDGQGPAMLFVHGMCGDAEVWADQGRRFADRYTCVRYDRRGHTRIAAPGAMGPSATRCTPMMPPRSSRPWTCRRA